MRLSGKGEKDRALTREHLKAKSGSLKRDGNRPQIVLSQQLEEVIAHESMAMKGAALQNYNTELIHRIEELREKRDEIKKILQVEEEEKANIQKDLVVLTKRLAEIDDSLSRKYAYTNEYDKTIHEVEGAYSKVSDMMIHAVKRLRVGSTEALCSSRIRKRNCTESTE